MKIVSITLDVYSGIQNSAYRVYVDSDMMTERTFAWPVDLTYITEHIVLQTEAGSTHTLRLEPLDPANNMSMKNITVDGRPSEATFTIP